jgi:hypothetical protein
MRHELLCALGGQAGGCDRRITSLYYRARFVRQMYVVMLPCFRSHAPGESDPTRRSSPPPRPPLETQRRRPPKKGRGVMHLRDTVRSAE